MKKLTIPAMAGALAIAVAGCGGGDSKSASTTTSSVLKSTSGLALYTPEGESTSNIRCTGACASIWKPVRPGDAKVADSSVIMRPDGTKQLAANGKPLYTFAQDSPGAVTGNGVSDSFGAKSFTWHAVQAGGTTAAAPASQPSGSGGGYSGY